MKIMKFFIILFILLFVSQIQTSCFSRIWSKCMAHKTFHFTEDMSSSVENGSGMVNRSNIAVTEISTSETSRNIIDAGVHLSEIRINILDPTEHSDTEQDHEGSNTLTLNPVPEQPFIRTRSSPVFTKHNNSLLLRDESNDVEAVQPREMDTSVKDHSQGQSMFHVKKQARRNTSLVLQDSDDVVEDVRPEGITTAAPNTIWQQLFPSEKGSHIEEFERLFKQGKYWKARCLGMIMNYDDLLKLICSIVKTVEQYNGIHRLLWIRKMIPSFYAHGDFEVVRKVIVESKAHALWLYEDGDLEIAISLTFKEDHHDRFANLLAIRHELTVGQYVQYEPVKTTSFELFLDDLFCRLDPIKTSIPLKRFLIFYGKEFKNKHPNVYKDFCHRLVRHLKWEDDDPMVKRLLFDLVGQPSLLTSAVFAEGFLGACAIPHFGLYFVEDWLSTFIKYSWDESIQEGLTSKYMNGGRQLWTRMIIEYPDQFYGDFMDTDEWRANVGSKFPTKQEVEKAWYKQCVLEFQLKLEDIADPLDLFPKTLWKVIAEYAVTWIVV